MKELKPSGLFYVAVPMDAKDFAISDASSNREIRWFIKSDYLGETPARFICKLPDEYWGIIVGTVTAEHIDFDVEPYVSKIKNPSLLTLHYKNYKSGNGHDSYVGGLTPDASFRSLLTANDVHFVNPYELKGAGHYENVEEYFSQQEKWLEAESKLVEKILILKPL